VGARVWVGGHWEGIWGLLGDTGSAGVAVGGARSYWEQWAGFRGHWEHWGGIGARLCVLGALGGIARGTGGSVVGFGVVLGALGRYWGGTGSTGEGVRGLLGALGRDWGGHWEHWRGDLGLLGGTGGHWGVTGSTPPCPGHACSCRVPAAFAAGSAPPPCTVGRSGPSHAVLG